MNVQAANPATTSTTHVAIIAPPDGTGMIGSSTVGLVSHIDTKAVTIAGTKAIPRRCASDTTQL